MRSVGLALAWEIWGRHRFVMALTLGYLLVLALLVNILPVGTFDREVIAPLTIPLAFAVLHLMALFSHGDQADIAACESGYPRRLFTLPLRTAALVGWPLVIGAAAVALFWLVLGGLILRSVGLPAPLLWVAVFLAALLAWLQALTWFPFFLPFLRILVAVLVLGGMATGAVLGHAYRVSPTLLLAVSGGLIPLGYLVAVAGVARARRGDAPVWNWRLGRRAAAAPARPFAAAAAAMFWLERRRHGFILPLLVGLLMVPQLMLLYYADPRHTVLCLLGQALCIPLMATAAGASLGSSHPWSRKIHTMAAFTAARPVTTFEMVAVKFRGAARTTLVTWGMVCLGLVAVLPFSLGGQGLVRGTRRWLEMEGARGGALLLLLVLGLPALTWKWIIDQFWIGLTGRRWIVIAMSVTLPAAITGLGIFSARILTHPDNFRVLHAAIPWVVSLALLLKLGGGLLVARALLRRGLVAPRTLRRFAVAWAAGAAVLFGLAFWLMPPEVYSPLVVGCTAVLLALPLVRLGLAPLALDWNRHR